MELNTYGIVLQIKWKSYSYTLKSLNDNPHHTFPYHSIYSHLMTNVHT